MTSSKSTDQALLPVGPSGWAEGCEWGDLRIPHFRHRQEQWLIFKYAREIQARNKLGWAGGCQSHREIKTLGITCDFSDFSEVFLPLSTQAFGQAHKSRREDYRLLKRAFCLPFPPVANKGAGNRRLCRLPSWGRHWSGERAHSDLWRCLGYRPSQQCRPSRRPRNWHIVGFPS